MKPDQITIELNKAIKAQDRILSEAVTRHGLIINISNVNQICCKLKEYWINEGLSLDGALILIKQSY